MSRLKRQMRWAGGFARRALALGAAAALGALSLATVPASSAPATSMRIQLRVADTWCGESGSHGQAPASGGDSHPAPHAGADCLWHCLRTEPPSPHNAVLAATATLLPRPQVRGAAPPTFPARPALALADREVHAARAPPLPV